MSYLAIIVSGLVDEKVNVVRATVRRLGTDDEGTLLGRLSSLGFIKSRLAAGTEAFVDGLLRGGEARLESEGAVV